MKNRIGLCVVIGIILCASAAAAQTAPGGRAFVDINGGVQLLSPALDAGSGFLLFGESGTVRTNQDIGAGLLGEVRLGHRIGRRLGIAIVGSGFTHESAGHGFVSEPSPILVASPTVVDVPSNLRRREIGYHPQMVWFVRWSEKFDVSLFAGPSFVRVQQTVFAASVSAARIVSIATANERGTAVGGNAGIDATHALSGRWGVGVFGRYVLARVDLPSATGVKAGGLQAGGGLRFKF